MEITKDITIEELVDGLPPAIDYLKDQGIRCIRCGEPIWGTLEEAAEEKGFGADDIEKFVADLVELSKNPEVPKFEKKFDVDKLDM
jgi:methionine synthase II (cobalamin-independent)